ANMKYPNEVYNNGLAYGYPMEYAYGTLVLWTMDESIVPSMDSLVNGNIQHIAVANPKTAPYGAAAMEVLAFYDLYERTKKKLVYGESIAQTNQFIVSRSAEIGFTSKSVVLSPKMRGKGRWIELADHTYSRIDQGVVRVKRKNADADAAKQFYDFLFSGDAHQVLKDFGYLVPEQ
ncbi:MAG TPA: molybdate ABC transporter substrate-binding protein, partial [Pricia sp.]|nr:molybdate ABC transporter substrate-binding protein [Pricia sp.]